MHTKSLIESLRETERWGRLTCMVVILGLSLTLWAAIWMAVGYPIAWLMS